MRQKPKVVRLRAVPGVLHAPGPVPGGRRVQRHQPVQRLRRHGLGVVGGVALQHVVRVEGFVAETLDLQRCEHVQFLHTQRIHLLRGRLLRQLHQQLGRLGVAVRLAVELNRLQRLLLLEEVVGVLAQHTLNLLKVVALGELHSLVPLVEQNAAVHRRLDVRALQEALHRLLAQPHGEKLLPDVAEHGVSVREGVDELLEAHVVLQKVEALHQLLRVLGLRKVRHRLAPLLPVCIVLADLVPGQHQQRVVSGARLRQLLHLEPVPQPHAHLDGQVHAVHVPVNGLSLVKSLEVRRHLRVLLARVVQKLQLLHKLDPLVVRAAHKPLVRNGKVQVLQRVLRQYAPQAGVRVVLYELVGVVDAHVGQDVARVPQRLGLEVDEKVFVRVVRGAHHVVQQHGADLQVRELADEARAQHGLLGLHAAEDVHARLLHDGKQLRVVVAPAHAPAVLALQGKLLALQPPLARRLHIKEGEDAVDVDD
mmetsp:Transcript_25500/g.48225  ORF Transcript_25500/g.48225 Transcript_25500/m.48225 type:complete len:479 (-) Transcript_25500:1812-3248(-)